MLCIQKVSSVPLVYLSCLDVFGFLYGKLRFVRPASCLFTTPWFVMPPRKWRGKWVTEKQWQKIQRAKYELRSAANEDDSTDDEIEVTDQANLPSCEAFEGRRVIELDTFVGALEGGCKLCGSKLALSRESVIGEQRYGLASVLQIQCDDCGRASPVPLCKKHYAATGPSGKLRAAGYDVNTKAAQGKCYQHYM